tara:strand:- start:1451 stop:1846 length:396 start_codon:yes stop_codon:yes gene_type:complete
MSLTEWFGKGKKGDWVDIGAPKKGGKFQKCGRSSTKGSKRKYPKCVPRSKAKSMTKKERESAVRRKRAKPQGVGGKPTYVKTDKEKGNPSEDKFLARHMRMQYKKKPNMTDAERKRELAIGYKKYENRKKK